MVDTESNLLTVPPNTEEFEIFEGRFQTTREEIATVCDSFIQLRDYGGIAFQDFQIGWAGDQRIYYGIRKDDSDLISKSILLGYVDVSPLKRLSNGGVRIRVMCVWAPLLKYWEELPAILIDLFPVIESEARVNTWNSDNPMILASKKPGRQTDPNYDEAHRRIEKGEDVLSVFKWYCDQEDISEPDKFDRKRFKEAMKRREGKNNQPNLDN